MITVKATQLDKSGQTSEIDVPVECATSSEKTKRSERQTWSASRRTTSPSRSLSPPGRKPRKRKESGLNQDNALHGRETRPLEYLLPPSHLDKYIMFSFPDLLYLCIFY